jgi:FdhD protein
MVSGRISFEIAQKAAVAGISMVAGVSAASSLAVELADDLGMTLIGFVRGEGLVAYTGQSRLLSST